MCVNRKCNCQTSLCIHFKHLRTQKNVRRTCARVKYPKNTGSVGIFSRRNEPPSWIFYFFNLFHEFPRIPDHFSIKVSLVTMKIHIFENIIRKVDGKLFHALNITEVTVTRTKIRSLPILEISLSEFYSRELLLELRLVARACKTGSRIILFPPIREICVRTSCAFDLENTIFALCVGTM